jgi:hypothetical protein
MGNTYSAKVAHLIVEQICNNPTAGLIEYKDSKNLTWDDVFGDLLACIERNKYKIELNGLGGYYDGICSQVSSLFMAGE